MALLFGKVETTIYQEMVENSLLVSGANGSPGSLFQYFGSPHQSLRALAMETNLTSTPLSSYLSALGLLKIASTQLSGIGAAGSWRMGRFQLELSLSPLELSEFMANRYQPSPCLTPWNKPKSGGPGFLEGQVPAAIEALSDPRFEELRRVADTAARVMPQFVEGGKVKGDAKRLAFEALSREADSEAFAAWLQICAVTGVDA